MNKLEDLKNQINQIMEENKPAVVLNSDADKTIRELEKEITSSGLKSNFEIRLSDLAPEKAELKLAGGQFTYTDYSLSWKHIGDENFRLILTNLPHKNAKILLKTPLQFKEAITELLPVFSEKLANQFK
ncbi:hypothetical protein [Bacteriovorax sp. DB6_IX]|uniref:hypothetical protein n=1 Tax=Bacteriovorax sp. DB6_IX TaxID=1353530 RepID=UPI00038A3D62|nr:hypothetical protein [Bacteriovorax sp. DB6_IX]EQC50636.1 hypothetical protein M901_0557 [Bacteriovorax sp. DB6_IX]